MKTSKFKVWYFQNECKFWTKTSWTHFPIIFLLTQEKWLILHHFSLVFLLSYKGSFYKVNGANGRILYRLSVCSSENEKTELSLIQTKYVSVYSNFYLKMYDTNVQCLTSQLNNLIAAQQSYTDPERRIQVKKPSKSAVGHHIEKLLKRQITHRIETVSEDCAGLSHLGHLVSSEFISLKDQSLSLKYLSQNGKQSRN